MTELPATSQDNWQSTNKTVKHHSREITPTPTPTQVTPEPASRNRYAALDFDVEDLTDNLVVQRIISSTLRRQNSNNNNSIVGNNVNDNDDSGSSNSIVGNNVNDGDDSNIGVSDSDDDIKAVIEITNLTQGLGPITTGTTSSSSSSSSSASLSTTSSDSDSDSDNDTMQHENSTFEELVCTLELLQKNCTNPSSSKLDLTHIIRFRELLGTALAQIP